MTKPAAGLHLGRTHTTNYPTPTPQNIQELAFVLRNRISPKVTRVSSLQ